ncbi:hypothetical protein VTN77DRAFT_4987 [Rasamsonia byssochlamydoides]|uniref:uncharacterized protein n=1 Tax=Rasamsonia byssochlamydoides TaxID=89139 RepID=UPI0037423744
MTLHAIMETMTRQQYQPFWRVIEGLEEFFISTSSPLETLDIWRSMLRHKSTLRKFVHHQRAIDYNDQEPCDLPDLSFMPDDIVTLKKDSSQNPFSGLDLECIGICCIPKLLKPIISPLTKKSSLKVLHIRQSGSDLKRFRSWGIRYAVSAADPHGESDEMDSSTSATGSSESSEDKRSGESLSKEKRFPEIPEALDKFAQWAFGHKGFRSLQVLAFGDFSYNGRYSRGNVLLCRKSDSAQMQQGGLPGKNYRHLTKGDQSLRDLLRKYFHVLQACPTDLLLKD